jgi:hypothetical protein
MFYERSYQLKYCLITGIFKAPFSWHTIQATLQNPLFYMEEKDGSKRKSQP